MMISNIFIDSFLSFIGGVLAFLSPCIFPVLIAYFAFTIVASINYMENKIEKSIAPAALLIIIGLSAMFILNFFPSDIQKLHMKYYVTGAKFSGIIIFIFGLSYLDIIKIKILDFKKNMGPHNIVLGIAYLLFGVSLGVAWTHCLTPVLAKIISPMIKDPRLLNRGFFLLWIYAIGLAIPLLSSAVIINRIINKYKFFKEYSSDIKIVCGLILSSIGVALFINKWWISLSSYFISASHDSWKNSLETYLIELLK